MLSKIFHNFKMSLAQKAFNIPIISGIFIISSMMFLGFVNFENIFGPDKTIIVEFKELAPLPDNVDVYYRGHRVGKVTEMNLSDDYKKNLLTVKIFKKDFNPPKNIYAQVRIENYAEIRGRNLILRKYLDLVYPDDPSSEILQDGDTIKGVPTYLDVIQETVKDTVDETGTRSTIENIFDSAQNTKRISEMVNEFLERNQDKLNEIVDYSQITTENLRYLTQILREYAEIPEDEKGLRSSLRDIPVITEKTANITHEVSTIAQDISIITGDQEFQEGVVKTTSGLGKLTHRVDKTFDYLESESSDAAEFIAEAGNLFRITSNFIRNTDIRTGILFQDVSESGLIYNTSYAMNRVGFASDKAGGFLDGLSDVEFDEDIKGAVLSLIRNTDRLVTRYDCIGSGLSDFLSQRFLLFQLTFGRPGAAFEHCIDYPCPIKPR